MATFTNWGILRCPYTLNPFSIKAFVTELIEDNQYYQDGRAVMYSANPMLLVDAPNTDDRLNTPIHSHTRIRIDAALHIDTQNTTPSSTAHTHTQPHACKRTDTVLWVVTQRSAPIDAANTYTHRTSRTHFCSSPGDLRSSCWCGRRRRTRFCKCTPRIKSQIQTLLTTRLDI